jgi:ABC-type multidrug transport system ATPase subunit
LTTPIVLWYAGRANKGDFGAIKLPADESARLMADHVPATMHFRDITYTLQASTPGGAPGQQILHGVSGRVRPGEVLAIIGASGAGKSTLLDILARRAKRGTIGGVSTVNGRDVPDGAFRRVCGFVDQEDTLMRTLTVYETVLYSALLRLPREMSAAAKKFRVMETLNELGILSIKDSLIGDATTRGISGGEKRRVSIACELVTSPSILFLDEPTSGT